MKFEIKNLDKFTTEIRFTSTAKEYDSAVDKAYERTKHKFDVQGFRKGKVPRKVIEKTYGEGVFFEDAFTELADIAYVQALNENNQIRPYGEPKLEMESFVAGVVVGKIILKVLPEITLGAYKGLNVPAILNEFTPEMVDAELRHAQMHHTHSHPADGKVSENGDIVVIDFVGSVDGVEFDGGKATDYELELGSHSFIDTFEDQLVGHKAGEHVTVNVMFPTDYGAKSLAGKNAVFECDVKSVNTKHVPEIDDNLAKHVANIDTLEEWKKEIEAQVKHELDRKNQTAKEDAIIANIVDNSKIELPAEYLEAQLDAVMRDLSQRLAYQGMRIEDYANYLGTTVEKLREERRDDAERIAKTKQVLEAIVRAEDMHVSDDEIDAKIEEIAKMSNKTLQEYKKTMDSRRVDYIYSDILMSKLMAFLTANNTVTPSKDGEVSPKKATAKKTTAKKETTETKTPAKRTCAKKTTTKTAEEKPVEKKTATKSTAKSATKTTAKTATKTTTAKTTKSTASKSTAKTTTKKTTK
ncbi:MAG: trigger factor [Clostridia bacterium]|nr:trigger factor [Clostridia bacterium]